MTSSTSVKHCSKRSNDDNEKYSLRQRHKRSSVRSKLSPFDKGRTSTLDSSALLSSSSSSPSSSSSSFDDNFEVITTSTTGTTTTATTIPSTKCKTKAPPLSKYRRKTANARERTRMKEINSAFEVLRKCVPQSVNGGGDNSQSNEKLTKITTLRLAMTYINMLSNALEDNSPFDLPPRILEESKSIDDIDDHSYCSSDNYHLTASVAVKTTDKKRNECKSSGKKSKKRASKQNSVKQQNQPQRGKEKVVSSSLSPAPFNSNINTTTSATAEAVTLSSSTGMMIDDYHSITGILLESDGESLHLSETCLSPLSNGFNSVTPTSISSLSSASASPSPSHLSNPLELKLLLETEQHHPPSLSCISPLETLDTFNPFGDLLYTELSDFYL